MLGEWFCLAGWQLVLVRFQSRAEATGQSIVSHILFESSLLNISGLIMSGVIRIARIHQQGICGAPPVAFSVCRP